MQGTSTDESNFLRSWTGRLYLWFAQVPDLNPSLYTTANYFPLLKTSATTGSGNPVDKFHFTYPTVDLGVAVDTGCRGGLWREFRGPGRDPAANILIAFVDSSATGAATLAAAGGAVHRWHQCQR